jgi:hypothetical protein
MERRKILRAGLCLWGLAQPLSAAAPTETRAVCLRAAGVDLVRLGPLTVEVMIGELDHLLAIAGTRVEWHWAAAGTETAPDELQVVFLDSPGRCVAGQPLLGSTATGQSGPPPVIWIYCPSVVRALGLRADSLRGSFFDKRALGVALGRVVAHELVHALAPEVPHGSGLMAPGFRPETLRGPGLALDVSSATLFNAAARSLHGDSPPPDERRTRERIAAGP